MPHVCRHCQDLPVCFYSIHWLLTKTVFNSRAPDPDCFSSFFFSQLWDPKLNDKLFITDSLYSPAQQSPRWSAQLRFSRASSGISVAPITLVFVCNCSRQMSENHPLTDLCSSTSEPPSTPTPKPWSTRGWKHLEAKCTKSSRAHAKLRHGIAMASRLPALPLLCFLINPGSSATHVSLACFLPKIWKEFGLQAFETRLKGLFYSTLGKTPPRKRGWQVGKPGPVSLKITAVLSFSSTDRFQIIIQGSQPISQPSVS